MTGPTLSCHNHTVTHLLNRVPSLIGLHFNHFVHKSVMLAPREHTKLLQQLQFRKTLRHFRLQVFFVTIAVQLTMCTAFRTYYACGHLKTTSLFECSGTECEQADNKRITLDRDCQRCLRRKALRIEREEANPGENFFYFIDGDSDADDEDSQHDARRAAAGQSDRESGSKNTIKGISTDLRVIQRNEGLIGCNKEDCGCIGCEYRSAVLDERAGQ